MLFNSFDFLFYFPIVVFIYYVLSHKYRLIWLLFASYFFYFYWEPSLVVLLFTSTIIDYFCGMKIETAKSKRNSKNYLYISVFINLGLLAFFKYLGFFTETTNYILDFFGIGSDIASQQESYNINQILLPVGISFYTFQTMSYSIDVYRKKIKAEKNFIKYALYVSFFPQLVAGPIERAGRLIPQFYKKISINTELIKQGIIMMAWGFFLKIVAADRIGIYVDEVFSNPSIHKGLPLILGSFLFVYQIYYDFSAYSTIAIGAAKVLGFDLMQNFNKPMFFKTIREIWQRWHISLLIWLRDYLFMPLAKTKIKRYWIVLIIFFANGLWHGANWTFVVWGLLNGVFLLFEAGTKKLRENLISKIKLPIPRVIYTFAWQIFCWMFLAFSLIFFRAPTFKIVREYLSNLFIIQDYNIDILKNPIELLLMILLIVLIQTIHYFKGNDKVYELITQRNTTFRWLIYLVFIISIVFFSVNRQNNFIYFQF